MLKLERISNIQQFYVLMRRIRNIRTKIVDLYLRNKIVIPPLIDSLYDCLGSLREIPQERGMAKLAISHNRTVLLNLNYEVNELEKDLFFIEHSEEEFYTQLEGIKKSFSEEIVKVEEELRDIDFKTFIFDRDGLINDRCGRYISAVESVYNAVSISRFAAIKSDHGIILTSAPLEGTGVLDICVTPLDLFIYAGSNGREYLNKDGFRESLLVDLGAQDPLYTLYKRLLQVLNDPKFRIFSLIGSGMQLKVGQITIARQDIFKTVEIEESDGFLKEVESIIRGFDPDKMFFEVEDTGLDIEIFGINANEPRLGKRSSFTKGDGIKFIEDDIGFNISEGECLICGDTSSVLPVIYTVMEMTDDTRVIVVTKDPQLMKEVRRACPHSLFVSEHDILAAALNNLSKNIVRR